MKAVMTHARWLSPPRSATIRGSAVLTMFWSSEANAIVVKSPAKLRPKAGRPARPRVSPSAAWPSSTPGAGRSGIAAPLLISTAAIMTSSARGRERAAERGDARIRRLRHAASTDASAGAATPHPRIGSGAGAPAARPLSLPAGGHRAGATSADAAARPFRDTSAADMVLGGFFGDGGCAMIWKILGRVIASGFDCGAGGRGKVDGPLGLARTAWRIDLWPIAAIGR